jgi:hypothetical protein
MLERGLVHAHSYGKEIPASDWIRHRSALEHVLRDKEVLGIRPFILSAAQLTKPCSVDVDELMAAFALPSVETPPVEPPATAWSSEPQKGVAPPHREGRTEGEVSLKRMICDAYETGGARNKTEAREKVCERAEAMGLRVTHKQFNAAFPNADVRGRSGPRPEKSPPKKLP